MNKKLRIVIKGSAVALAIMLTTGCAAELQSQVDALNARVDTIASDVARAQSAADAAGASASEARQMSSGAQSTANEALRVAELSAVCCEATNEKIDRMFQKGMSK
jgi:outer membrane murein-binding lipoprotein Lpp